MKENGKPYGFTKDERSSFPYWFAHWCAFQMVALNCHAWKPGYLLHDWYKPWLRLFWPYERVQKFHNEHSSHHLLKLLKVWLSKKKFPVMDWDAMVIDWECSRFTKQASPLTAKDEIARIIEGLKSKDAHNKTVKLLIADGLLPKGGTKENKEYMCVVGLCEDELYSALDRLHLN